MSPPTQMSSVENDGPALRASRRARLSGSRWMGLGLLGLVALALIAVALVDIFVQSRIEPRQEIINTLADPALAVTTDIQLTLARRMSSLRGYIITGGGRFLDRYEELRGQESVHLLRLDSLSSRLDGGVALHVDSLEASIERWDQWIDRSGMTDRVETSDPSLTATVLDQQFYDGALDASLSLEEAIHGHISLHRAEIASWERLASRISFALVLLALLAAAGVGLLGYWMSTLNDDLKQRQLALQRVTESRARLLRGFSHDLKNPLGAADAHAALLESGIPGGLNDAQMKSVQRIRATLRSGFHLINELVQLGRVEAGQLEIRPEPVDLRQLLQKVADDYRPQAEAAGLGLSVDTAGDVLEVHSDPNRIEQIIANLVSNAVKYTEAGSVRIRARQVEAADAPARIHVDVEDTGAGIPADKMHLLFQEFSRLQVTSVPGAGLGLSISYRIAHALGGEITVTSEVGRGSVFTLSLPVQGMGTEHHHQVRGVAETPSPAPRNLPISSSSP